jgi:hypothetical protein
MEYVIVFIVFFIILFVFLGLKNKNTKKVSKASNNFEGKTLVLPKIEVSEEIDQYVKSLIDFVYADGTSPSDKILSKENQHNILCQILALNIDLVKYEPFVQSIYENTVNKINTYATIEDSEEWYHQLRFALESTIINIIRLTDNKRGCFQAIDNLTDRLLQMDREKFKNLFFRLRGYHFWYVYNEDEKYKITVGGIKNRLKLYHGIKQADFYKKCPEKKDDVSYVLYFAEKAGEIVRKEDGRTYRLYLPEDDPAEVPPYEYTSTAVNDGDFNYKNYWKDIEKELKKNDGILQTEFYTKFTWASEILSRALRDAEKDGKVLREKKGNTYILHMPK